MKWLLAGILALFSWSSLLAAPSEDEPGRLLERAIDLFKQGRYEEAAASQDKFVTDVLPQIHPTNQKERDFVRECLVMLAKMRAKLPDAIKTADAWEAVYSYLLETGSPQPYTYDALVELAEAQDNARNLPRAEELRKEIVQAYEKHWGKVHPAVVFPLCELAILYCQSRHLQQAEATAERALALCRNFPASKRSPDIGWEANNALAQQTMGLVRETQGDFKGAYPYTRAAWEYFSKETKDQDLDSGASLRALAFLARANGDLERAEEYYRESLRRIEAATGTDTAITGLAHYGLGLLLDQEGRDAEAIAEYRATYSRISQLADSMGQGARYLCCSQLACALLRTASNDDTRKEAHEWARKGLADFRLAFASELNFGSEQLRLEFQGRSSQEARTLAGALVGTGSVEAVADLSLLYKGAIADSVSEDHLLSAMHDQPLARDTLEELNKTKAKLYALPKRESDSATATDLQNRRNQLEQKLTSLGVLAGQARDCLISHPADVAAALPVGASLVDFLIFTRLGTKRKMEDFYGAVVYQHGAAPRWVELMAVSGLRSRLGQLDRLIGVGTAIDGRFSTEDEKRLHEMLVELRKLVWEPLNLQTGDASGSVVICPDGDIHRVPFAVLPSADGTGFLAGQIHVSYVDSARHVIPSAPTFAKANAPVIFAQPDFGAAPTKKAFLRFHDLTRQSFDIKAYCDALGGVAFTGKSATEAELRAQRHPLVLHLCTHGFYLPPQERKEGSLEAADLLATLPGRGGYCAWENQLQRSGVALAGAQKTVNAWAAAEKDASDGLPNPSHDGILTAEEAGQLDLTATQLVTVASCVSGRGFTQTGEGVLGLQRGFLMAGARNVIAANWEIPGSYTADFFLHFYQSNPLRAGAASISNSFATFQAAELRRLAEIESAGYAIYHAGAFTLTFRR